MKLKCLDVILKLDPNFSDVSYFETGYFLMEPVYKKLSSTLEIQIQLDEVLPFKVWEHYIHMMSVNTACSIDLHVVAKTRTTTLSELKAYIEYYVSKNIQDQVFMLNIPQIDKGRIIFQIMEQGAKDKAIQRKHLLQAFLKQCGIVYEIIIEDFVAEVENIPSIKVAVSERPIQTYQEPKASTYRNKSKKNLGQYTKVAIKDLQEEISEVVIQGDVFHEEIRELRTGKVLQTIGIADDSDAIMMKRFERGAQTRAVLEEIKVGCCMLAYGRVEYDSYMHELMFVPESIEIIEPQLRSDDAEEKRVELHVHTKLSEMDGVANIEEYIQTAYRWGMKAIACTDHNVVQAYPKAQHQVSSINAHLKPGEEPFKMLYGIEMNMVDPVFNIVTNPNDANIEKATYCVFDLETTGLSPRFDHIIEFGGQIMRDRACIASLQLFIKPPVALSAFTMNLTGITDVHMNEAKSIEESIDLILDFIKDYVLVAHNASFDIGFLNEVLLRMNRPPLTNPVVDTLDLSRCLQSERKGYRLGQIARSYGIRYDEEVAHRADYDADILAQTYMNMLNELDKIRTFNDLQNMSSSVAFKKVRPKHVTLLAKNMKGLKEIFELVTLSHTKYLSYSTKTTNNVIAEPRIIREEIALRRANNNILIGSSCLNGEIFDIAQTKGQAALVEALDFYDYIEIQPLNNYQPLIARGAISDEERLKTFLQCIYDEAIKKDKIVVASGDAHYVHPKQKKIRDIYISAQAIGGLRHPLYLYNAEARKKAVMPNQHLFTTKEMLEAFKWFGEDQAYEMCITNTNKIAAQIEPVFPIKDRLYPPSLEGSDEKLRAICYQNAHAKYGENLPLIVAERLEKELDSIIGHGFYVIYYISHLLVKKSLKDGYMVGSRGSVGSSFVATMADITEVNPLAPHYVCPKCQYSEFFEDGSVADGFDLVDKECPKCSHLMRGDGHDIPFETFLGFEGDKVPDIDLNFSGDYQAVAHAYTKEVFGEDHVFRAGTIGTVAETTAFGYVKGFGEEMGITKDLRNAQIRYLAKGCEGVKRTTGQHPGGIIVIPNDMDVHDFTPVQYPANNPYSEWKTTHFEFHDIHDNVLKLDILGHVDPTAMKMLERISGVNPVDIPMNDVATMSIFSSLTALNIDTSKYTEKSGACGIPEFGTAFVRGILELTKPTTFEELLKISGLSHGTDVWLGNAKELIDRNTCTLRSVIGCRDDIMVYLLHKKVDPKLAFTVMESVRKGKGLSKQWISELKLCGVEDWYIDSCEKIKYMFPKAHATAYVMMAVRIAWFKVHMPLDYYCMFFSIRCDAYDIETMIRGELAIRQRMSEIEERLNHNELKKEVTKKEKDIFTTLELALEMVLRGYFFANISLKKSHSNEFIKDQENENRIIPPFASLDGLGGNVADTIVVARAEKAFISKEDLQRRTSLSGTLVKKLESMEVLKDLQDENQMSLFE